MFKMRIETCCREFVTHFDWSPSYCGGNNTEFYVGQTPETLRSVTIATHGTVAKSEGTEVGLVAVWIGRTLEDSSVRRSMQQAFYLAHFASVPVLLLQATSKDTFEYATFGKFFD